jgi:transcriptional regulator with XRE-family HTH domain
VEMRRFGEKVRTLRLRHGMTLRQLADALGYESHGFISDIEFGRKQPTGEFILRVSRVFGIPMDQLGKDELDLDAADGPSHTDDIS